MAILSTEIILLYTSENKRQYLCIDYILLIYIENQQFTHNKLLLYFQGGGIFLFKTKLSNPLISIFLVFL